MWNKIGMIWETLLIILLNMVYELLKMCILVIFAIPMLILDPDRFLYHIERLQKQLGDLDND